MCSKYYSFSVVLLCLCFNALGEELASEDQNVVLGMIEDTHVSFLIEKNIKNHISLLLTSLRNEFFDKNKIIEQKLDALETIVKHGFDETIDDKLLLFEKKIEKYDSHKFSELKMDINQLKAVGIDNRRKLESFITTVDNSHKLDLSTVTHENFQSDDTLVNTIIDIIPKLNMLLNLTVDNGNIIRDVENKSIENFLELSAIKNKSLHDSEKINELINTTTAVMHQLNETKNRENEFREIRWSDCKLEVVKNNLYYDYSRPLHLLADDSHRHVTLQTKNNGDTKFFLLHVGIKADTGAAVLLSQLAEPKGRGYHFRILIWKNETVLGTVKDGDWTVLKTVHTNNNLSHSRPFGVYIKIADDTVEVRREEDRVPLLLYKDAHLAQVRYFGFSSHYNTEGNATFLYDC